MAPKRKAAAPPKKEEAASSADDADDGPPPAATVEASVNPRRIRPLRSGAAVGAGPVVYWMSRDARPADNWALAHAAAAAAARGAPLAVAFTLVPAFLGAGARQFGFMLRGLRETAATLSASGVPFFLLRGDPGAEVPDFAARVGAAQVVTDYSPLRLGRAWRAAVADALTVPFDEVDAHNVVPVWVCSDKREVGARTLRPRLHRQLPEFLTEFPSLPKIAPW
jgi:deoxyribodipyrimidine photo-lyase